MSAADGGLLGGSHKTAGKAQLHLLTVNEALQPATLVDIDLPAGAAGAPRMAGSPTRSKAWRS